MGIYSGWGAQSIWGQVVYFGSHDRFGAEGYCENDYVAWSAPVEDLSDWRYEGVIFRKDQTPWNTRNQVYYAPDCVQEWMGGIISITL